MALQRFAALNAAVLALTLGAWGIAGSAIGQTANQPASRPTAASPSALPPLAAQKPPVRTLRYVPPAAGAPRTLVAAASRDSGVGVLPVVLAPRQTGLTLRESPTLFWFIAMSPGMPMEISLIDEEGKDIEPLLELVLPAATPAGLHMLDLAKQGVRLRPGVDYRWSVRLIVDPERPSRDVLASGTLRRVPPPAGLPQAGKPSLERAAALASGGLWYDMLAELQDVIASQPGDPTPRQLRAELLEAEGHATVARWDRQR